MEGACIWGTVPLSALHSSRAPGNAAAVCLAGLLSPRPAAGEGPHRGSQQETMPMQHERPEKVQN